MYPSCVSVLFHKNEFKGNYLEIEVEDTLNYDKKYTRTHYLYIRTESVPRMKC